MVWVSILVMIMLDATSSVKLTENLQGILDETELSLPSLVKPSFDETDLSLVPPVGGTNKTFVSPPMLVDGPFTDETELSLPFFEEPSFDETELSLLVPPGGETNQTFVSLEPSINDVGCNPSPCPLSDDEDPPSAGNLSEIIVEKANHTMEEDFKPSISLFEQMANATVLLGKKHIFAWSGWTNNWDGWSQPCKDTNKCTDIAMAGMYSYHANSKEDRRFQFLYRSWYSGMLGTQRWWNGWTNWKASFNIYKADAVMVALWSYHANSQEDRRFNFFYQKIATAQFYRASWAWIGWSGWDATQNSYCKDQWMVGLASYYSNTARDRVFNVLCGKIVDVNECSKNPCNSHGRCYNYAGGFKCYCYFGYEGTKCELSLQPHNTDLRVYKTIQLKQNHLWTVLPYSFNSWTLDFDIKPLKTSASWASIMTFTTGTFAGSAFGNRYPALWFYPKTFRVYCAINTPKNNGAGLVTRSALKANVWSHVRFQVIGRYMSLFINGKLDGHADIGGTLPVLRLLKVFFSDPYTYYPPAGAEMKNVEYVDARGGHYLAAAKIYDCPLGQKVTTLSECTAAFSHVKEQANLKSKRGLVQGDWAGIQPGCSVQWKGTDQSPHWNKRKNPGNSRVVTGEFRRLCRKPNVLNLANGIPITLQQQGTVLWGLVMKLSKNDFCFTSTRWTDQKSFNDHKMFDVKIPGQQTFDAKSLQFHRLQKTNQLRMDTARGKSVVVTFAWANTPEKLMASNEVPLSFYPDWPQWKAAFGSDRNRAPILVRAGKIVTDPTPKCRTGTLKIQGCGQPCMFCMMAGDGGYSCPTTGAYNDISSGMGLSAKYCGGGDPAKCSASGHWSGNNRVNIWASIDAKETREYEIMGRGTVVCKPGHEVASIGECEIASKAVNKKNRWTAYQNKVLTAGVWNTIPYGCSLYAPWKSAYLNSYAMTNSQHGRTGHFRVICRKSTGPPTAPPTIKGDSSIYYPLLQLNSSHDQLPT